MGKLIGKQKRKILMKEKLQYEEKSNNEKDDSNILTTVEVTSSDESEILKYERKRKKYIHDINIETVVTVASSEGNSPMITALTIENWREASEQLEMLRLDNQCLHGLALLRAS